MASRQAAPLNADEVEAAKQLFAMMDADHDGKVNHSDLKKFFDEAGWGLSDDDITVSITGSISPLLPSNLNSYNAKIFLYKPWINLFKIIINVLVSSFCFI